MSLPKILTVIALSFLVIGFQNCGKVSGVNFSSNLDSSALGDAVDLIDEVTSIEECVEGVALRIWLDSDGSGQIASENYMGEVIPYSGSLSATQNYNYYGYSAHPVNGPSPRGYEVNVFFYEEANGDYSLNFFANLDDSGSRESVLGVDLAVYGNNKKDSVLLSDDKLELKKVGVANGASFYEGDFWYSKNTDGGVVGPLRGDDFEVQMSLSKMGDNNDAVFYSANGSSFKLKTDTVLEPSFIIKKSAMVTCN